MTSFPIVLATVLAMAAIVAPDARADTWKQPTTSPRRFTVLESYANQAVLDKETGLVWELAPSATFRDWSNAVRHCNISLVGGRYGWRLPTLQELASLLEPTASAPALPAGHPFVGINVTPGTFYWSASSSTVESFAPAAYCVGFSTAVISELNLPNAELGWCVRGGQGGDTLSNVLQN